VTSHPGPDSRDGEVAAVAAETGERRSGAAGIELRDLHVSYTTPDGSVVPAVEAFSFDVRQGEFVTLIGPSGCGKTSVLRAIGGLVQPAGGEVRIDHTPVRGPQPDRVAYVFQDFALFPWRTALANVEIALELKRLRRGERRRDALAALATVGLEDVARRYPAELSGGMKQRVALARALVANVDVLLLDEPFGALDEQTRLVLGAELLGLLEAAAKTIVFVTHSLREAVYLSDRVVAMTARPGRIKRVLEIPLPRPRAPEMMASPEFERLEAELFKLLFEESTLAVQRGQ